jgi:hypothetical protein
VGKDGALEPSLARLEETRVGEDDARACPGEQIGDALAQRGYWRLCRERWLDAAADYEQASRHREDPLFPLSEAEALLHLGGRPAEVRRLLALARARMAAPPDRSLRVYAALLRWAASRQQGDETERSNADGELRRLYDAGTPIAREDEDRALRRLVCGDVDAGCVYDALESDSPQALDRILGLPAR